MLKAEFIRDIYHSYLVLQEDMGSISYEYKMIEKNKLKHILPVEKRLLNGTVQYYYKIDGRQPLKLLLEKQNLRKETLRAFLMQLDFLFREVEEYLLDISHFVLEPEFLYPTLNLEDIGVLFYPSYEKEGRDSIKELAEYFLFKVDSKDEEAMGIAYQFFQITRKPDFLWTDVQELMLDTAAYDTSNESKNLGMKEYEQEEEQVSENRVIIEETETELEIKKSFHWKFIALAVISLLLFIVGFILRIAIPYAYVQSIILIVLSATGFLGSLSWIGWQFWLNQQKEEEEMWGTEAMFHVSSKVEVQEQVLSVDNQGQDEADYNYGETVFAGSICKEEERKLSGMIKGKQIVYLLKVLPMTIGKSELYSDIILPQEEISRIHARFLEKDGKVYVEDCNSLNGTFKNGIKLRGKEQVLLESEDEISFAGHSFIYL